MLAVLAAKAIFGPVPLQIVAVVVFAKAGTGFTVTVIVEAAPTQEPAEDVGVTWYCTEPATELLGLLSVCPIVPPEPALEPVTEPVMVPIVQL